MKISVITPVKNGAEYLTEAVQSVLGQEGNFEIEYLIVDGGSDDGTLELARSFVELVQKQQIPLKCKGITLHLLENRDDSMYTALAAGLRQVSGEVVCYLNSDDFFAAHAFSTVTDIFERLEQVNWISGLPVRYNKLGEIVRIYWPLGYIRGFIVKGFYGTSLPFIQQESVFWRRKLNEVLDLEQLAGFKRAGDYFIWNSFAKNGNELVLTETLFGGNRQRPGQLSETPSEYFREFNSIKSHAGVHLRCMAWLLGIAEKLFSPEIKRRFPGKRIVYRNKSWEIWN